MIQYERSYWCEYCPREEELDIPVEAGRGFISLRRLAEHVLAEHPEDSEMDTVEALVEDVLSDAEALIENVITPTIEEMRSRRVDENPFGLDWNGAVDDTVERLEARRAELRFRIREERNALNREYFHELAEKYVDHWVAEAPNERSIGVGLCSARAMGREAKKELGYYVDKWVCYRYLEEALPEDHPEHDPEATV